VREQSAIGLFGDDVGKGAATVYPELPTLGGFGHSNSSMMRKMSVFKPGPFRSRLLAFS
jgi:hypothetical protein